MTAGHHKKNMVINRDQLRDYANLLNDAIRSHLGESEDVEFLANSTTLNQALKDAVLGIISCPMDLGLRRWHLESDIQKFPEISHLLAQFSLLLEGYDLPDE